MSKNLGKKITSGILLCSMFAYTMPVLAYTKEETVYSKLNSEGTVYQTTVSNHLKNTEKEQILKDLSDLSDIENVSGDQEVQKDGNTLTWKAEGEDIYYQGKTSKELPIECKVVYELDGKEVSKEDIIGKSGEVKITLNFTNKEKRTVTINGKQETMYVPFVVACGTIIDNENNKDIEVTNGKMIDDGTKTMVFGIAMPGMQESLGISKNKVEVPTSVSIKMKAQNFEMKEIYAYVTPKLIEEDDLDVFDELDSMYSKLNTLQSATNQLEEGAKTLQEGTNTYYEKSQEFNSAMSKVTNGISSANENYTKINEGINTLNKNGSTLASGAEKISDGTTTLSQKAEVLNSSVGLLKQGGKKLEAGETQLSDGVNQILTKVETVTATDNTAKIANLEALVQKNTQTINSLKNANTTLSTTKTQLTNKKASLNTAYNAETDNTRKQEIKAQIDAIDTNLKTVNTQITSNEGLVTLLETNNNATNQTIQTLKATDLTSMKELVVGLQKVQKGVEDLQTGTNSLNNGLNALGDGTQLLEEKTKELAQGSNTLYKGTKQIEAGTKTLAQGSNQMKAGLSTISDGSLKLQTANDSLVEGAKTINEGTLTLSEGVSKLNKEGISVLYNTINGEVKDLQTRLEKLQELSDEYNNFTMVDGNAEGKVKFIMMIDSAEESKNKQEAILPSEENTIEEKQEN